MDTVAEDDPDALVPYRPLLWGLGYRLTGNAADADDIVQETFLRALGRPLPEDDAGRRRWLARIATNLALDLLRRRRRTYRGPWLPSPVEIGDGNEWPALASGDMLAGPEARYERAESLSFAFLLALEALTPRQRAVLVLRDVFGRTAAETAAVFGVSEGNVRITHLRARRAMESYDRERLASDASLRARMQAALAGLVDCLNREDVAGLEALLASTVRTITDGGGEVHALKGVLAGRERVMRFHLRVAARRGPAASVEPCVVNGLPALWIRFADRRPGAAPAVLLRCELDAEGRIREIHSVVAPSKLRTFRPR